MIPHELIHCGLPPRDLHEHAVAYTLAHDAYVAFAWEGNDGFFGCAVYDHGRPIYIGATNHSFDDAERMADGFIRQRDPGAILRGPLAVVE